MSLYLHSLSPKDVFVEPLSVIRHVDSAGLFCSSKKERGQPHKKNSKSSWQERKAVKSNQ